MTKFIAIVTVLLVACATASAAEPLLIPISELKDRSPQLLGIEVTTHACFVSTMHGGYVEPCGNKDWRKIILAYSKDHIVKKELQRTEKERIWLDYEVEGNFTGTFVQPDVPAGEIARVYFEITSFDSLRLHEP
jgi:hypothetical protein